MNINVVSKTKNELKLEIIGEGHTFLNLLRENCWKKKCDQTFYILDHPYLSNPKLNIKASNPKAVINNAVQLVIDDAKAFSKEFARTARK